MKELIFILSIALICSVSYSYEDKWIPPCNSQRVWTEVLGAFVYDFKGYLTKVGDYPVDERPGKDCRKLKKGLATSCSRVGEYWFCVCFDKSQESDMGMLMIEDKTAGKK